MLSHAPLSPKDEKRAPGVTPTQPGARGEEAGEVNGSTVCVCMCVFEGGWGEGHMVD